MCPLTPHCFKCSMICAGHVVCFVGMLISPGIAMLQQAAEAGRPEEESISQQHEGSVHQQSLAVVQDPAPEATEPDSFAGIERLLRLSSKVEGAHSPFTILLLHSLVIQQRCPGFCQPSAMHLPLCICVVALSPLSTLFLSLSPSLSLPFSLCLCLSLSVCAPVVVCGWDNVTFNWGGGCRTSQNW